MDPEAMFKISTFFLTPGAKLVYTRKKEELVQNLERVTCALMFGVEPKYGRFSPLITFTLNRNLRSASSALKLHLTSSYKAWETGGNY